MMTTITKFADNSNLFRVAQFGFPCGRWTEFVLLTQKDLIHTAFEEKKSLIEIYIDFSNAFDQLNHLTLVNKLQLYGVRGLPLDLIACVASVEINDHLSSHKPVNMGVQQGSILGPLLFNFYYNDIKILEINRNISYTNMTQHCHSVHRVPRV